MMRAAFWYRKAAWQEDFDAQWELGHCYADGKGLEKDEMAAAIWYRSVAIQGFGLAQLKLGMCYQTGFGVPLNLKAAMRWYQKAAEQGCEEAIRLLRKLNYECEIKVTK